MQFIFCFCFIYARINSYYYLQLFSIYRYTEHTDQSIGQMQTNQNQKQTNQTQKQTKHQVYRKLSNTKVATFYKFHHTKISYPASGFLLIDFNQKDYFIHEKATGNSDQNYISTIIYKKVVSISQFWLTLLKEMRARQYKSQKVKQQVQQKQLDNNEYSEETQQYQQYEELQEQYKESEEKERDALVGMTIDLESIAKNQQGTFVEFIQREWSTAIALHQQSAAIALDQPSLSKYSQPNQSVKQCNEVCNFELKSIISVVRLIIPINYQDHATQILQLCEYLQSKQLSLIIVIQYNFINHQRSIEHQSFMGHQSQEIKGRQKICVGQLEGYQSYLCELTNVLLCNESLFLETISLEVDLYPLYHTHESIDVKTILAIYRRTIPVGISSLIFSDWFKYQENNHKLVLKMHFLKHLPISWLIQFITQDHHHAEALALETQGIQ